MMSLTGNKGFTLVEVMVATAVLSLGTVLIHEAFFISLDSINYCSNYLNVMPWMNEKLWEAQDNLGRYGTLGTTGTGGKFTSGNKDFNWILSYSLKDGLYKIAVSLSWREGRRRIWLTRDAYAIAYEKK